MFAAACFCPEGIKSCVCVLNTVTEIKFLFSKVKYKSAYTAGFSHFGVDNLPKGF